MMYDDRGYVVAELLIAAIRDILDRETEQRAREADSR